MLFNKSENKYTKSSTIFSRNLKNCHCPVFCI